MNRGKTVRKPGAWHRTLPTTVVLLVLIVSLAPLFGTAAGASGDNPAARAGKNVVQEEIRSASPIPAVTLPATPAPARQNRTTLIKTVKNVTERPKVSVPTGFFLIIVAVAAAGLLAILYLLTRRRGGGGSPEKKNGKISPGNPTIVGETVPPVTEPSARSDHPADLFPPSLGKRFVHTEFIGEGGLARVFRAQNARTGMTVAVKIPIRFDEETGMHFTRDIILWQGLGHKNIIRILSSNILPVPYIEMEYAPSSVAALRLPVSEEEAIAIFLGTARGIAYAHEKGIAHRDIKPENILLSSDGIPKITDWGLGKAIGDTRRSSMIGFSPAYAAPEQVAPHRFGRPGPATDIYQLGMLLCELLTGTTAFHGESPHDLYTAILEKPPVIPPWNGRHGRELTGIILRCLEKKPADRYASVRDLLRDIERIPDAGNEGRLHGVL